MAIVHSRCRIVVHTKTDAKPKTFAFTNDGMRKASNIVNGVGRSKRGTASMVLVCAPQKWGVNMEKSLRLPIGYCTPSGCKLGNERFGPTKTERRLRARHGRVSKYAQANIAGVPRRRKRK